jgi:hypothetical protein
MLGIRRAHLRAATVTAVALCVSVVGARAQTLPTAARDLVVAINAFGAPSRSDPATGRVPTNGAGIIIAAPSTEEIWIATARHVVAGKSRLEVTLPFAEGQPIEGTALWEDGTLDVAVVSIPVDAAVVTRVTQSFARLGQSANLRSGSPVYPVGCPDGRCWEIPSPADQVLNAARLVIDFQSTFVAGGSSGGALFNDDWEVVGMVVRNDIPRAEAVPIDTVLGTARRMATADPGGRMSAESWASLTQLRRPSVPRGGYGWSLGGSWLTSIAQPDVLSFSRNDVLNAGLESRLPSFRVTLTRRTGGSRSWHVGGIRLAPANISVTAAVAGLGLEARTSSGRLAARVFAEGAAGRVRSRYDVGGFTVVGGSGSFYQPVWGTEDRDGVGLGGGVVTELALMSHIVLEVTAASWYFGMPQNAPDVPYLYVGGGLRIGG